MYAICETVGCHNFGIPIEVPAGVDVGCGPCGRKITNVSSVAPEPITEVPEWLL